MAKASEQYEKIFLAVAALLLIIAGWFAFSGYSETKEAFAHQTSPPKGLNAIEAEEDIGIASEALNTPTNLTPAKTADGEVDLYTGAKRFVTKGEDGKLIKLQGENTESVHEGIKNDWWFNNGVGSIIGFKDALQRDPDGDGFTNEEEHTAKTHPNDIASHPPLISKLDLKKIERYQFELSIPLMGAGDAQFKIRDPKNPKGNKSEFVKAGDIIFTKGTGAGRFKLKTLQIEEVFNDKTNSKSRVKVATIEEIAGPNVGRILRVPARAKPVFQDLTAVLRLRALGLDDAPFKVQDKANFALPPNAAPDVEKSYRVEISEGTKSATVTGPNKAKVELKLP